MAIKLTCKNCGSEDIEFRADVQWDGEKWVINYIYGDAPEEANCYQKCRQISVDEVENLAEVRELEQSPSFI